ncbi:MAG: VOC family protein [Alphaproteobacteria bacterium]
MSTQNKDPRPPVAIGHVMVDVPDVADATKLLTSIGLRRVAGNDRFTVLELRGGTHLIVQKSDRAIAAGAHAPFDLMVDDVDATRTEHVALGLDPSPIERGTIHDTYTISAMGGYRLSITSSHAGDRPV